MVWPTPVVRPQACVHFGQHPTDGYGVFDPNMPMPHLPPAFVTWPGGYIPMFSHVWSVTPQLYPGAEAQGAPAGPGTAITATAAERAWQGGGGGGGCRPTTATGREVANGVAQAWAGTETDAQVPSPPPPPPPEPTVSVSAPGSAEQVGPDLPEPVALVDAPDARGAHRGRHGPADGAPGRVANRGPTRRPGHRSGCLAEEASTATAAARVAAAPAAEADIESAAGPEPAAEIEPPSRIDLEMAGKCFYAVLGLARTATSAEIRTAYRKLARRWHPDKNRGSEESTHMFKLIGVWRR